MRYNNQRTIRRHPHVRPMFAGLRRYDRKPARLRVEVIDEDGDPIPFETANISESGVFVSSNYLYEVGRVHELRLRGQGGHEVRLRGRVVRVEGRRGQAGMAYQFLQTDRDTWSELTELVASV